MKGGKKKGRKSTIRTDANNSSRANINQSINIINI